MKKKVTIVLDDIILKKLRTKQAKEIARTTKFVSLSSILNTELRKSMK